MTTPAPMPSRRRRLPFSNPEVRHATVSVNRVPEVTPSFWLIKLMAVTMGETAATISQSTSVWLDSHDAAYVGVDRALIWQFGQRRYVPHIYWAAVVLISPLSARW